MRYGKLGLILTAAVLMTAVSVTSFAQAQPGAGGGRQGGGQRRGGGFQLSVATVPASILASELGLSDAQKTKIKTIQDKLAEDLKPLTPKPGDPPPDQQTAQENRTRRNELTQNAVKDIEAELNETQKTKWPDVQKSLQGITMVGIPVGALDELKLTPDEKTKIAKIADEASKSQQGTMQQMREARQNMDQQKMQELGQEMQKNMTKAHEDATAVLTADQKKSLEAYLKAHPQPQFGGGRGGRAPGGAPPGGAPPPAL